VRIHTLVVYELLFVNTDVTLWAGPFHEAVRPVRSSDWLPPWTTLVFDATAPAPKTVQPLVPLSRPGLLSRFPLAAKAALADPAASEANVRTPARLNLRTVKCLLAFIA